MKRKEAAQRAADLLKRGATMLSESCPECFSPLFKLGEEVWCATCGRQVVILKTGESIEKAFPTLLFSLEEAIFLKVQEIADKIRKETDINTLHKLSELLSSWLNNLSLIRKLKRSK